MSELRELSDRVRRLEDEREIARLIASYGPAVDAADADAAAGLWTTDGSYDVEGWSMSGRAAIHDMVNSSSHRGLVDAGCCHFLGPAVVTVDGDTAVAVCESLVLVRTGTDSDTDSGYRVWRAAANHFELVRTPEGWRISRRTTRLLDGNETAHRLLRRGVAGEPL